MQIDYEIQRPSTFSLILKDLSSKKNYYKIKNHTSKTLTLYCAMKSLKTRQNFKKIGRQLKKSNKEEFKLNTTIKFNLKMKKIVLGPNEKIKIYFKQLLPIYFINEETKLLFEITGFKTYEKIVFDEYEEEELKAESKFIYEEEN